MGIEVELEFEVEVKNYQHFKISTICWFQSSVKCLNMDNQHHRIFRLTVDISLPPDEAPSPIQDRISSMLKTALYQKMNQVFATFNDVD